MENTKEIIAALRELQGEVSDANRRAAGPNPIPVELREGASVTAEVRAKALDLFTSSVYSRPSDSWSKAEQALVREQINSVLKSL